MRTINATWEQRNLGVECVEFELASGEEISEVKKVLDECQAEYQIVKIPVGNVNLQLSVQDSGFQFYETNVQLERRINEKPELPSFYTRFARDISYRDATQEEIETILAEVAKGHMFTTDKVALDPHFSTELAGRRYSLWARDILEKGAKTVLGLYRGNIASFTIYEVKEKYYQAFIGGMLEGYRDKGLGFMPLHVTAEHIFQSGGGLLKTGVSTNNPSILRLQLLFGAQIVSMSNTFIKHM